MKGAVLLCLVGTVCASTVYVSDSAGSDEEGTGSASKPFKTIKAAIDALAESGAENITLMPGRYMGLQNTGLRVSVDSNTVRIVSQNGPLETFVGSPTDYRAFQVGGAAVNGTTTVTLPYVAVNGTDDASTSAVRVDSWKSRVPNIVISGITIIGGMASKGGAVYVEGGVAKLLNVRVVGSAHGGVYIKGDESKVLIANAVFVGNGVGDRVSESLKSGGAIFLESGELHCDSCRFTNNTARQHGGAIYALGGVLRLSNTNFTHNTALEGGGGAIFFANSSASSYVVATKFRNNTAIRGGALFVGASSAPQFINATFVWNYAKHIGGAMVVGDSALIGMKRTTFLENTAEKAGGAIAALGTSAMMLATSFMQGNRADLGGGLYASGQARPSLTSCVLNGNVAVNGGAVYAGDTSLPTMAQTELSQNQASRGGALYSDDSARPHMNDCRVKNNFASMDGGALFAAFDSAPSFEETHFIDNNSNLGDPFHISDGAQQRVIFTQCSVFPHPKHLTGPLTDQASFPEELHIW